MLASLFSSLRMLVVLTVLTGVVYPLATWGVAQLAFPRAANGSLIETNGKAVGSSLIGQPFDDPKYFWSRPSATSPMPYNGASSSGSNQGPRNPALTDAVRIGSRGADDADPANAAAVPADLVTASASGLDPHIASRRRVPAVARRAGRVGSRRNRCVRWSTRTPRVARSDCWASLASTSSSSTSCSIARPGSGTALAGGGGNG